MIVGFELETQPLTAYEKNTLLPIFIWCLSSKVGKAKAVTNAQMVAGMKKQGYKVTDPRVRKIINHIRQNGLVNCLVAMNTGYFVATAENELLEYEESLLGRLRAIGGIYSSIRKQRNAKYPKTEPSLFNQL